MPRENSLLEESDYHPTGTGSVKLHAFFSVYSGFAHTAYFNWVEPVSPSEQFDGDYDIFSGKPIELCAFSGML
jgi:hypothetical protein